MSLCLWKQILHLWKWIIHLKMSGCVQNESAPSKMSPHCQRWVYAMENMSMKWDFEGLSLLQGWRGHWRLLHNCKLMIINNYLSYWHTTLQCDQMWHPDKPTIHLHAPPVFFGCFYPTCALFCTCTHSIWMYAMITKLCIMCYSLWGGVLTLTLVSSYLQSLPSVIVLSHSF